MTSGEPFSWAGLTRIKRDGDGPIARLLGHSQASLISEALHRAFELAYGGEEKQAKRREFLRRFHDERSAVEALHELLALALLRVERWRLVQVEPSLGGPKHPDFLMATLAGEEVLVEVKTVHRGGAFAHSDDRRNALAATLMRNLAARGYACRFLDVLCSPSEFAAAPLETTILELVLQHARRVSFKSRAYYAVELPAGGCISFRLEDSGFSGPMKTRFENLEDIRGQVSNSIRDLLRSFRERKELNSNYGDRASGRVLDGGVQIGRSGSATPGIVVLCLGDADWSVRESIAAARAELNRKKAAGKLLPVGVVFASFFHPEVERQKAKAPDWAAEEVTSAERKMPAAFVQAAWVDLGGANSLVKVIKPLSGDSLPMGVLVPDLVPFPSSVDERALFDASFSAGHGTDPTSE